MLPKPSIVENHGNSTPTKVTFEKWEGQDQKNKEIDQNSPQKKSKNTFKYLSLAIYDILSKRPNKQLTIEEIIKELNTNYKNSVYTKNNSIKEFTEINVRRSLSKSCKFVRVFDLILGTHKR